jgi:hypothetical protein
MRDIKLNNLEVLSALNEYKDFIMSNDIDQNLYLMCRDEKPEDWLSEKYLHEVMSSGTAHEGFPITMQSYDGLMPAKYNDRKKRDITPKTVKFRDASSQLNSRLMEELSARVNTLNTVYPPKGFISWHNNANASGFNVLFTWSETGDGWFKYYDQKKKEIVTIPDVPGWQCKMGYFGSYIDPEKLCYHAAYAECWRISVAYVFAEADELWQDIIEDIENPI